MAKPGKRTRAIIESVDADKAYTITEAVALVKSNAKAKFDETVEIAVNLGVDPKYADQMVRGVVGLPNGTGKTMRVAVFARGAKAEEAEKAGADIVGAEDLMETVQSGKIDFDRCIATPDMMGKIGRLGRILGRKGLMPNPRTGTVVQPDDIAKAVEDSKKGRVEYRLDRSGLMHMPIGKASFDADQLLDNLTMLMDNIVRARPSGVKGQFIRAAYLSSTMGPSVSMDVAMASELRVE